MKTYTIRELGGMFQLPSSTLRYYEEEGLLTGVEWTPEGQRVYGEQHVRRLETICCFKGTGMSIAQLRAFFQYQEDETAHVDEIIALLRDQREQVLAKIREMEMNLERVERKLRRFEALREQAGQDR